MNGDPVETHDPYPVVRQHLADAELGVPDDALDLLALRISADVESRTPRHTEQSEADMKLLKQIRDLLEWILKNPQRWRPRGDRP